MSHVRRAHPEGPASEQESLSSIVDRISKLKSGITKGERDAYAALVASGRPLTDRDREAIALIENPPSGRPRMTDWQRANKALRRVLFRCLLQEEIARMKAIGERPRGGLRTAAIQRLSDRHSVSVDQIQNSLKGK